MAKNLSILIVGRPNDLSRRCLEELARAGYRTVPFYVSSLTAVKIALRNNKWQMVFYLADSGSPPFLSALKLIHSSGLDLPSIVLCHKSNEHLAFSAMKAGASDYILKSNLARLVPTVEREIRGVVLRLAHNEALKALEEIRNRLRCRSMALEETVNQRTSELMKINRQLKKEVSERLEAEKALIKAAKKRELERARSEAEIARVHRLAEEELREHRDHLDLTVRERTKELTEANRKLRSEIMRRIHIEKNLFESQRFVHRITDATPNLLYLYDVIEGKILYINTRVCDILGYSSRDINRIKGSFFSTLVHPDDVVELDAAHRRISSVSDNAIIETEYRMKNSAGNWRWFCSRDVTFKRTKDGVLKLIIGIAQDITERKKSDTELKHSREQLRTLLAHLQSVREEERAGISREIHDELGQALTALKMDVAWVLKRTSEKDDAFVDKLRAMSDLIDRNIQTVKKISRELRPVILDDLGLPAAIEWQAEEFQKRTGIECKIRIGHDVPLDKDRATVCFRIFQETLTNVARHARARNVNIVLSVKSGDLVMKIADNGKGITQKQIGSPSSIGLIGMKERVSFIGGSLSISGQKNKGTTVTVNIPMKIA